MLNKIRKDDAEESFKRSLLPIVQQQPELFGRHAEGFGGSDPCTVLLNLAHRMASLIMAYGFDIEKQSFTSEDEDDNKGPDGSSHLAYEIPKGMVPMADLFNAGTFGMRSFFYAYIYSSLSPGTCIECLARRSCFVTRSTFQKSRADTKVLKRVT